MYANYIRKINNYLATNDISSFKHDSDYTHIVEHRNCKFRNNFYDLAAAQFSNEEIGAFCSLNDKHGDPELFDFSFGKASSNSLKYIYHSHLVLSHLQSLGKKTVKFVEIGGGYGGLSLCLHMFSKKYDISIESYSIIDLPPVLQFQSLYLKTVDPGISVSFHDASTFGADLHGDDYFLVGIYSLGELPRDLQEKYFTHLFPKVSHGFLIWNTESMFDFGRGEVISEEIPKTGPFNKFVHF